MTATTTTDRVLFDGDMAKTDRDGAAKKYRTELGTWLLEVHQVTCLADTEMYKSATVEQRAALEADRLVVLGDGLSEEEYLEGVVTWPDGVQAMLDESSDCTPAECDKLDAAYEQMTEISADAAIERLTAQITTVPGTGTDTVSDSDAALPPATMDKDMATVVNHQGPIIGPVVVVPTPDEIARQEEERMEAVAAAEVVYAKCLKVYAKSKRSEFMGTLSTARLADEYLHMQMAMTGGKGAREQRAAHVDRLERDLQHIVYGAGDTKKVKVNDMLGLYHAWRLLANETGLMGTAKAPGIADHVRPAHYEENYVKFVERANKDTVQETWVLLPGFETECLECFREACQQGLSGPAIKTRVADVLAKYRKAVHAKAVAEREAKMAEVARQKAELTAKMAAKSTLAQEVKELEQEAAAAATPETKAIVVAELEQVKAEVVATDKAVLAAAAEAEKAAAVAKKADAIVANTAKDAIKAEAVAEKLTQDVVEKAATKRERATPKNLLPSKEQAQAATAKDWGESMATALCDHPEWETALEYMLLKLGQHPDISKPTVRAINKFVLEVNIKHPATTKVPA